MRQVAATSERLKIGLEQFSHILVDDGHLLKDVVSPNLISSQTLVFAQIPINSRVYPSNGGGPQVVGDRVRFLVVEGQLDSFSRAKYPVDSFLISLSNPATLSWII